MIGKLAASCGFHLPIQVMESAVGFYLGTTDFGIPLSRESNEYWTSEEDAKKALQSGNWTQKEVA